MSKLYSPIMADPECVHATKYTGIPYSADRSRFRPGWWILPMVMSGSVSWIFILRAAFFT